MADDVEGGGPCLAVVRDCVGDSVGSVLGLRFMAAVHRLVLTGEAPALARHYPSVGGEDNAGDAWPASATSSPGTPRSCVG